MHDLVAVFLQLPGVFLERCQLCGAGWPLFEVLTEPIHGVTSAQEIRKLFPGATLRTLSQSVCPPGNTETGVIKPLRRAKVESGDAPNHARTIAERAAAQHSLAAGVRAGRVDHG
jgi:uncharacterized membrane protein